MSAPVCVVGMHRAGTSMVARLLNVCGLYLGQERDLMPPSPENPAGYWENLQLVSLNDELLGELGGTWDAPPVVDTGWSLDSRFDRFRERAASIAASLDVDEAWGWKDPRTSLTLEFWQDLWPEMRVVVCLRDPLAIARSINRRRDRVTFEQGLKLWLHYYTEILKTIRPERSLITHFDSYPYEPFTELARVLKFSQIQVNSESIDKAITSIISLDLRHHFATHALLDASDLPEAFSTTYRTLFQSAGPVYQRLLNDQAVQRRIRQETPKKLQDELTETEKLLGNLRCQYLSLQADVRELEVNKCALEVEVQSHLRHIDALERDRQSRERDNQDLCEQNRLLEEQRLSLESANQKFRQAKRILEKQKTDLKLENQELLQQRRVLEGEHQAICQHKLNLEEQCQTLVERSATLERDNRILQQDHLAKQHQIARLGQQLEQSQEAIAAAHGEEDALVAEIHTQRALLHQIQTAPAWRVAHRWWRVKHGIYAAHSNLTAKRQQMVTGLRKQFRTAPGAEDKSPEPGSSEDDTSSPPGRAWRFQDPEYATFCERFEPAPNHLVDQHDAAAVMTGVPSLAIVTVVNSVPLAQLAKTAISISGQTFGQYHWYLVGDEGLKQWLATQANVENVSFLPAFSNTDDVSSLNRTLHQLDADYIALLDAGDELAPFALYSVAKVLTKVSDADFIYSDHDEIDEDGFRNRPWLKPNWSPEMMFSVNLLEHLSVFRRQWIDRVGTLNTDLPLAEARWDWFWRISEQTDQIHHIPQILYHRRQQLPPRSIRRRAVVMSHLRRARVLNPRINGDVPAWGLSARKRISIIIPSRDKAEVLEKCLTSIFKLTSYDNYQVLVVDTGSVEAATESLYGRMSDDPRFRLIHYPDIPFNFSKACNLGAAESEAELLLFLNNDTEVLQSDWLQLMAQWFELPSVGIVGSKLLYPDGSLQHAGVWVGVSGLVDHLLRGMPEHSRTIFGSDDWYRNLLAVTAACLLVSREAFDRVEGFDENYLLNFSDVAFCLNVHDLGYRIVYTPHVKLFHHESLTHQGRIPRVDFEYAREHFRLWLMRGDPYFNQNLDHGSLVPRFRQSVMDTAFALHVRAMSALPQAEVIGC